MCDSRFKLEMTRLNLGELREPGILEVMSDSSTRLVRSLARVAPQRESGTIAYLVLFRPPNCFLYPSAPPRWVPKRHGQPTQ